MQPWRQYYVRAGAAKTLVTRSVPVSLPGYSASFTPMSVILLVEDEPNIADMLAFLLEDEGYTVLIANDGKAGLGILAQSRPDIIVSDVMMPGMGGLELCRIVRSEPAYRRIPVVLVSAAPLLPRVAASVDASFMLKPINVEAFLHLLGTLVA
jgi:CheY-like chemotaxis protein